MKVFNKTKRVIALFILTISVLSASAQCKNVAKEAIRKLAPYTHTGGVSTTTLVLGEPSQVHLSFYKGLNYKIQVSTESQLGTVNFRIVDEDNVEIYNSKTGKSDSFEFYSNSSQELVLEIVSDDKAKQGCAVVVVGMQVPKSNSIRNL
ncbi:MAG: hypothetical protein JWP12_1762 [Bacteroidetes bacterium]|nr:hypothetical protein [Bacteroidota bacterium]